MSAAARLLRRRGLLHPQQYRNALTLLNPSLANSLQSGNSVPKSRIFSALANEGQEKPASRKKALKFTAAGAAVIVLSSAAWYTTRDLHPQVQHEELPSPNWNVQPLEEKTTKQTEDIPLNLDGFRNEVQKDISDAMEASSVNAEVVDIEQLANEKTQEVGPEEIAESTEGGKYQTESDSNTFMENRQIPSETVLVMVEMEHVSAPSEESEFLEQEKPRALETQGGLDEDKKSDAESTIPVEGDNTEQEREELGYAGREEVDAKVEMAEGSETTGNKPNVETADSSYSDEIRMDEKKTEDLNFEEPQDLQEESLLVEILGGGSREYGAAQSVPRHASSSNDAHDVNTRGSSESMQENVSQDVDAADISRKEEQTSAEPEVAKVVGVDVLLGAIRTAEQLQAERDSQVFQEQLEKIKDAHKTEVKDFEAKILAYAQEADRLEKELRKEKELAEADLKSQLHKAEEKLQRELKRKEEEASKEKEKLEVLGKAHTAAAVAREKADHLEDVHAIQLQVNALRTAFYARSEEARISHTAHKLAMGAFALEDAVERGFPMKKEAELLVASSGGPGGDPLVDAVVSSLPVEALTAGSRTRVQLQTGFTKLKAPLRELVLIPAGGGGVFAYLLAKIAAHLKITEQGSDNVGDEGFEAVIGKVERFLAEGKLLEAAAVLERGAGGTAAERLATEWSRQARNRAIIEQALQTVQAHVIAVASGLS